MKIDHVNAVVNDLEKAKQFFLDLGFILKAQGKLEGDWIDIITGLDNVTAEYVALGFPNKETNLELLRFENPAMLPDDNVSKPNHAGFRHIAIEVQNIDAVVAGLKQKGVNFLSDIQKYGTGKRLCYFWGPEGILLELAEYK